MRAFRLLPLLALTGLVLVAAPAEASLAEVEAAAPPPVQIQSPWAPGGGA